MFDPNLSPSVRRIGLILAVAVIAVVAIAYFIVKDAGPTHLRGRRTMRTHLSSSPGMPAEPVAYTRMILSDRPIAFWPLHDKAKAAMARDMTGHFPATYVGSPDQGSTFSSGLGGDTRFDGVDDHVTANAVTTASSWRAYTMEAWVRLTQETHEEHIVAFNTASGANGPGILHDQPTRRFKFRDCEGKTCAQVFSKAVPQLDALHYLAVTVDERDQGAFYVDGQLQARFVSSHRPPTNGLFTIGAEYDTAAQPESFFHGEIGDVAIYARSLDAAILQAHYEAGL